LLNSKELNILELIHESYPHRLRPARTGLHLAGWRSRASPENVVPKQELGNEEKLEVIMDVKSLGRHVLNIRIIPFRDSKFNRKIVFKNLEQLLNSLGYNILSSECREAGKGTPLATRVTSSCPDLELNLPISIQIKNHKDSHFNNKIILVDLDESLKRQRIAIDACQTCEA
jgi:hypothetical protein